MFGDPRPEVGRPGVSNPRLPPSPPGPDRVPTQLADPP